MAGPAAVSGVVIDVDERTFQQDVIERSREVPVVVDFWAAWCGPCRSLGPILEDLAKESAGRFILARLDVDRNQRLAAQYGIQGIPAVKAFKGGIVAGEFVGALPRPAVRQFIDKLLPNQLDMKVAQANGLLAAGDQTAAEARLREVLAEAPGHAAGLLGLARIYQACGEMEEARQVLDRIPPGGPEAVEAKRLQTEIGLRAETKGASEAELRTVLAEQPADLAARYKLAGLLTLEGRYEDALDEYLAIVRRDRRYHEDGARQMMLYIFEVLGEGPLTRTYRNKLASVLFA